MPRPQCWSPLVVDQAPISSLSQVILDEGQHRPKSPSTASKSATMTLRSGAHSKHWGLGGWVVGRKPVWRVSHGPPDYVGPHPQFVPTGHTSIFTIHPCPILPPPIFDEQLPWARPCSRHGRGRQWTEETQHHLLGAHPVISSDRHTNH